MWERTFRQWLDAMFWWLPGRGRADDGEPGAERPSAQPPDPSASREAEPAAPAPAAAQSPPQEPAPQPAEPVKPAAEAPKPAGGKAKPAKKRPAGAKPKAAAPKADAPKTAAPKTAAPKTAAPKAAPASQPDDLTTIKGLGPAMQQKLASVGVTGFADLARADAQELTDKLKPLQRTVKREAVEAWIAAAREATKG